MGNGPGPGLTARTVVSIALALTLLVLAWPRAFGGATSYVVVSGISMQPLMESGDLTIVRRADSYEVGDVIAFRTEDGDVIHRIIGGDGVNGYVTQGDNVGKPDPYRPTDADVRGRRLLHIPNAGAVGLRITNVVPPWGIGAVAVALALIGGPKRLGRRRRVRAGRRPIIAQPTLVEDTVNTDDLLSRRRLLIAGACALGALLVLPSVVVAWTTPTTLPVAAAAQHQLDLAVTGLAGLESATYPSGRTTTIAADASGAIPDTVLDDSLVYAELTAIEVVASYALIGVVAEGAEASGVIGVDAVLRTRSGAAVELPTGNGSLVTGDGSTTVELDLAAAEAAFAALPDAGDDEVTGIELRPTALLQTPESRSIRGEVLLLSIDGVALTVSGAARTSVDAASAEAERATVGLVGISLPTTVVRGFGVLLLLGLGAVAYRLIQQEQQDDPELRVRVLYGSLLVELAPGSDVGGTEVRVASIAELARLAKRDQRSILHRRDPGGVHRYMVPDGDLTYAFVLHAADDRAVRAPDDVSSLRPTAQDVTRVDDVALESFDELSRLWLEPTADGVPGALERSELADGRVLYTLLREGQRFTYIASAGEKLHDTHRVSRRRRS